MRPLPLAILAILSFVAPTHAQPKQKLPNILWITCEDIGPHLGCYGDKYAETPNLDKFAKKAVRYTKAWSNAPVCAPARTTIITGMYATRIGAEHMRSMVSLPDGIVMWPVLLRRLGYFCTNNDKEDYNVVKTRKVWDESSKKAHYKNRPKDAPFFAVFNLLITHESQIRTKNHKLVHDPLKVTIPPYWPDTPEVRHDLAQYYDNITTMDRQVGELLAELESLGLLEDTIIFFFSDHGSGMPRNKRSAQDSGLHVPMMVHIPEAYKELRPKDYVAGGTSDRLVSFVDLGATVLSLAGQKAPEWMDGQAFLGSQQVEPRQYLFGYRGRMDERYDLVRSVRDVRYCYVRNYMPHRIAGQHNAYMFETPTTRVWKKLFDEGKLNSFQSQFWKPRPPEELYDLVGDPFETMNLVNSVLHAATIARFREVHLKKNRETRDVGFLPEDEMHRRAKDGVPTNLSKSISFAHLLDAAETASVPRPRPRGFSQIYDPDSTFFYRHDSDAAVRYWGVVGIYGRGKEKVLAHRADLAKALADPSPCVRIIAAEALGKYGDDAETKKSLDVLLELAPVSKNSVYTSLAALNALDYLGEKAAPGWDVIRTAAESTGKQDPRFGMMPARLVEHIAQNLGRDR